MSLKRDMLVEAGVTDKDALDRIMQAYGAGLENAKNQIKSELGAEKETLKDRLKAQDGKLEELTKSAELNAETKKAFEDLQAEYSQYKVESENNLAKINKTNAIALALKDVKAYDSDVLMKLIDIDKVELGEDGKPKLDDMVNSLKESKPFLFEQEQPNSPQITVGGNPNGNGTNNNDPFQAVINSYK
ncbi:scaffolding protein [Gemella sp. oral taxon 928]|uniref:phage scaffolding protein n=1 Tax=Gemella sp. oral taxon 928 TaxID=1785995 RepID=UPI0007682E48|nr:phage scaffolding protein [Gemella sp. oral taxon 928]AME09670.1 scaffolding protein [Gemella sp. oral taxon 928]